MNVPCSRIKNDRGRVRKASADYLAYSLIDSIVDGYFTILELLGNKTEEAENDISSNPDQVAMQMPHTIKRDLTGIRTAVWPARETVGALESAASQSSSAKALIPISRTYTTM